MHAFDYNRYRKKLARHLVAEPDKAQRRKILQEARGTKQYHEARKLYLADAQWRMATLSEAGFNKEAGIFEKVAAFAQAVREAGGQALLVGGAVRDEMMGIPPKDYDIEVYRIAPDVLRTLATSFGKVNEVGAAFGILKVAIDDVEIDISLPRRESSTGKGHRDFSISADPYMSIKEAARRRDFTFNALAKDILTGEVYDYFGGVADVRNRILRITDPERFQDDPLRVLRGVQFVGRFGLHVEDETAALMRRMRFELKHLPKERLKAEWVKLFLKSKKPSLGLQVAMEWGIFHEMHPDIVALPDTPQEPEWHPEGDVWIHTLMVVDEAAKIVEQEGLTGKDALIVMLAAFAHDFGKLQTTFIEGGRIKSPGHEHAGVGPANTFLEQIGIEKPLRDAVTKLVAEHLKPSMLYIAMKRGEPITDGAIKRLADRIAPATLKQLVCVAKADHLGRGPFVDPKEPEKSFMPIDYPAGEWLLEQANRIGVYDKRPKPIIYGRDLIALGFKPGKLFGDAIRIAEQLHEQGYTREHILELIHRQQGTDMETLVAFLETYLEGS